MKVLERLEKIDRRYVFLLILLAVVIPLLFPIGFKIDVSEPVAMLYRTVEELSPGSCVLFSFDYGPSTMPEVYPMNLALVRHCFSRDIKVIGIALWPEGVQFGNEAFRVASAEYGKEYGIDYINLGYKAGGVVVVSAAAEDIPTTFPQDYTGRPIEEFPIMTEIENFGNIDLIVSFSAGDPGTREYIRIAQGRYGKKVGTGVTAVSAPAFYPYLNAGQLQGLLGGMKGAAEYETLIQQSGLGTSGMDAQSIAHGLIILFIVLANVFYIAGRRKK